MKKRELKKIGAQVLPSSHLHYRDFLKAVHKRALELEPDTTYSQLSEMLGLPASNVIDHIIKGRRPLSSKASAKIAEAIQITGLEKSYFLSLVNYNNSTNGPDADKFLKNVLELKSKLLKSPVNKLEMEYFSKWHHTVIGEMSRLKTFESDPKWISKNIQPNIRPEQAKQSLEILEKLGIIKMDKKKGHHIRSDRDPSTDKSTIEFAVLSIHEQMADLGKRSLVTTAQKDRDVSSMTICIDEKDYPALKELIASFQDEIMKMDQSAKNPEKVHQLNIQLFPVSKSQP